MRLCEDLQHRRCRGHVAALNHRHNVVSLPVSQSMIEALRTHACVCVCVCVCLCLCVYVCSCVCVSYRRQHRCTHGHTYPCYGGSEHATRRLPATRPTSPSEQSGSCCCTCIHRYVFHSQVRDTYITARCADACGDAHIPMLRRKRARDAASAGDKTDFSF